MRAIGHSSKDPGPVFEVISLTFAALLAEYIHRLRETVILTRTKVTKSRWKNNFRSDGIIHSSPELETLAIVNDAGVPFNAKLRYSQQFHEFNVTDTEVFL